MTKAQISKDEVIEVRDLRKKTRYAIDNEFYDKDYAQIFAPGGLATYNALCRYSNKAQKAYPKVVTIATKTGQSRTSVTDQIQALELFKVVRKIRLGKMCANRYYLLDKTQWVDTEDQNMMSIIWTSLKKSDVHSMYFRGLSNRLQKFIKSSSNRKDSGEEGVTKKKKPNPTQVEKIKEEIVRSELEISQQIEKRKKEIREMLQTINR